MELFSEIYSRYFTAIRKVLEASQKKSLNRNEIEVIINQTAFSDSSFFIMPYLQSGEWNLLNKLKSDRFKTPITNLQKSWLKALLSDKRIKLFFDEPEIGKLNGLLSDVDPLYENEYFHYFDSAADGDHFDDEYYIKNFRVILSAIRNKSVLKIEYDSGKGKRTAKDYIPIKLNYSRRDDKFRLVVVSLSSNRNDKVTLNLSRIICVSASEETRSNISENNNTNKKTCNPPVVLRILKDRNAIERLMVQFAWAEKQTEYDESTDSYICRIFYDSQDETELLIRILSFGPVVKVLEPAGFVQQVRERIRKQILLNNNLKH